MTIKVGRLHTGLIALACVGLTAAGCSSSGTGGSGNAGGGNAKPSGTANVAYAASLTYLNEKVFGPDFAQSSADFYQCTAVPSVWLAADIVPKTLFPNVFITVGRKSIESLGPKFTKWYVQYASTSIVLAYNPNSKYAPHFNAIASGKKPVSDLFKL